ncbi:MAG: hypothetical protein Kow0092_16950 [Deferrisomatales bacterium]
MPFWPAGSYVEGLDGFDNDGTCTWTPGDDLYVEGSARSTATPWTDVTVKDRFGAEIGLAAWAPSQGAVEVTTKGRSEKVFLLWSVGDLDPGETASLVTDAFADRNPAGHQEYTTCGRYDLNSGAVVKFRMPTGKQRSFETGSLPLAVFTEDRLGDCDADGVADGDDPAPFDPAVP